MPKTLQQFNQGLSSIYDPQTALIKAQQAQLPQQFTAQKSALDQAKVNAFRDIGDTASARGMTFSGFTPESQAQYVGEKYLPARAELVQSQQDKNFALTQSLNSVNATRGSRAQDLYGSQQNAIAKAQAKRYAANTAAQAKIEAARINAKTPKVIDPYKGFNAKKNTGTEINADGLTVDRTGTSFFGPGNQPITAGKYYTTTGGNKGVDNLAQFLKTDPNSRQAYLDLVNKNGANGEITQALIDKYPYIFGG